MHYSFGIRENLHTIAILSRPYMVPGVASFSELSAGYRQFLKKIQPEVPRSQTSSTAISGDAQCEQNLSAFFRLDCPLNDKDQTRVIQSASQNTERSRQVEFLNEFLKTGFIDPEHRQLFQLAVTDLFTGRSEVAKGGSASGAIGVIWVNNPSKLTRLELLELFAHELTHQLVFLDEKRFGHYHDYLKVAQKDYYAESAILRQPRPLDKVLHSILVAAEVMALRRKLKLGEEKTRVHPSSRDLAKGIMKSIESIRSTPRCLLIMSERSLQLLDGAEALTH